MERAQIRQNQTYAYKTWNSSGTMKVAEVYKTTGRTGSWFVVGLDKTKGRDITVRPSQLSKV